jgi:hypothetical protein
MSATREPMGQRRPMASESILGRLGIRHCGERYFSTRLWEASASTSGNAYQIMPKEIQNKPITEMSAWYRVS